jgi:hypothetical protein
MMVTFFDQFPNQYGGYKSSCQFPQAKYTLLGIRVMQRNN